MIPKPKSQTEQVDDLMAQLSEEAALPSHYSADASVEEIERRLRNLKSENSTPDNRIEVNYISFDLKPPMYS